MLSATIPNYEDFAKWVGRIKDTVIYMQITNKRVVPLEHQIYLDEKNVYLVKDKNDKIHEDMIHKSLNQLEAVNKHMFNKMGKGNQSFNNKGYNMKNDSYSTHSFNNKSNQQKMTSFKIIEASTYLIKNNLTPAVIFVFSIKKIDEYAKDLMSRSSDYSWCSKEDSSKIIKFYDRCINVLSEKDRNLNQIKMIKEILKTGIGVHHAGLLPIVKEIIEVLYSKGLIKILFATTSFSIGLNMPTRTVLFTEIAKFNDQTKEILSSSEYLQMCGRAGRRGIDEKGNIFILLGDKTIPMRADQIHNMMKDGGTVVESRFRLSYKTIISILSRDIKEINQFFKESFMENKKMSSMQDSINKKNSLNSKLKGLDKISCIYDTFGNDFQYIQKYYDINMKLKKTKTSLWESNDILSYFRENPGTLIICKPKIFKGRRIVGMLVRFYFKPTYDNQLRILFAEKESEVKIQYEKYDKSIYEQFTYKDKRIYYIQVDLNELDEILDEKYLIKKQSIVSDQDDYSYLDKSLLDLHANAIIELNTKCDKLKIKDYYKLTNNDMSKFQIISERENLIKELGQSKCHDCTLLNEHYDLYSTKLRPVINELEESLKNIDTENLKYSNEFNTRIKVLKELNYVTSDDSLAIKGKAARELSTTDCVMMTETLLSGILDKLDVKEKIAFMSGFAFNKNEIEVDDPKIGKNFTNSIKLFEEKLKKIVEIESKYEFQESKYNRRSTFAVSNAILSWMKGESFKNVQSISNLEEGKLYTLIMRLFQLCDEIINFYKVLGLEENVKEYEEAKLLIMRDVINCKSLYVQDVDFNI